jgi:hypothetical protein
MGKGKAVPIGVRDVMMGTLRFAHPTNYKLQTMRIACSR